MPIEETDYFCRKCLAARRLLERGVRFVQIWSGNDNGFPRRNWDSHEDVERDHGPLARGMARGAAALIQDLKQRGLLEDTIVLWTTEFGRMPSLARRQGPRSQPVRLHQLALRRRHQRRHHARRKRRVGLQAARPQEPDRGLRHPRHDPAPARHRSHEADLPPQRHRPPADRRARARHRRHYRLEAGRESRFRAGGDYSLFEKRLNAFTTRSRPKWAMADSTERPIVLHSQQQVALPAQRRGRWYPWWPTRSRSLPSGSRYPSLPGPRFCSWMKKIARFCNISRNASGLTSASFARTMRTRR